jgi:hypothetical protein
VLVSRWTAGPNAARRSGSTFRSWAPPQGYRASGRARDLPVRLAIQGLARITLILRHGASLEHSRDLFTKTDVLLCFRNSVLATIPA